MPRNQNKSYSTKRIEQRLKNILLTTILRNRKNSLAENHDSNRPNNESSKKNNQWSDGIKWTDKASVIISFGALVVAGFLYWETVKQRELTKEATNAAVKAVNHSLYQDSINYRRDTTNDRAQKGKDSFNMDMTKKSLQEQIKSIYETQRQFKLNNKPFLQLINFKISFFDEQNKISIRPEMINLGIQPAKILIHTASFAYAYQKLNADSLKKTLPFKPKKVPVNIYYIKERPEIFIIDPDKPLDPFVYNEVKYGIRFIYLFANIIFENSITKEKRRYIVNVRIQNTKRGVETLFFTNENTDVVK